MSMFRAMGITINRTKPEFRDPAPTSCTILARQIFERCAIPLGLRKAVQVDYGLAKKEKAVDELNCLSPCAESASKAKSYRNPTVQNLNLPTAHMKVLAKC